MVFVQKNRFLYFARLHLVHFIQYSNLKSGNACATVCLQREKPKTFLSNDPICGPAMQIMWRCVFHVMTMDHTKTDPMPRDGGNKVRVRDVSFWKWKMDGIWKRNFKSGNIKKAHLTSWAEKAWNLNWACNLKKARLINDVRYQEWTEMTLDYKKCFLSWQKKQ